MKKSFKVLALCLAAAMTAFAACTPNDPDNPGKDNPSDGDKSKERSILSIAFEGQIGTSEIVSDDATTGTINIEIATDLVADMTKVKITTFTFSYKATASVAKDDVIDLTKSASIVVTAESGDTRTYSINVKTFSESFAGCYSITGAEFVGGVGQFDWGTLEMCTPEYKSWCWDQNGYGPTADYDDYFEIVCTKINDDGTTEGTCKRYGGVDGKHWNCVFAGASNKVTVGQPVDLRPTFRVLPLGESTWKRNYEEETITFKSKEGVETTCKIISGTIEIVSGTSKSFDVPDQGLAFTLNGDNTWPDESIIYTDWVKFVISPDYFALLVSKVDAIPAESKTEGSEGEIDLTPDTPDTPDDPEPEDPTSFEVNSLNDVPGKYQVSKLMVQGPMWSGSFVDAKEKNWEWNESINNEYDNILTISVTGSDANNVNVNIEYTGGEDGKFWDRVLVADKNKLGTGDVDLKYNFDRIPHGSTTASINTSDNTITYTVEAQGKSAKLLLAGDFKVGGATLKLDNSGIGIAFETTSWNEADWNSAWEWSDFERFFFHPVSYVMVFKKIANN